MFFLGCSGSLFWSSGGFWGHLWGSFSVVFLKNCVFWRKGGTIDFERPYNDFAVFWSSAASWKAAKMRKKYVRTFVVFLDVENTSRNGVFIFFGDFRGPSWVPGGNLFSVF